MKNKLILFNTLVVAVALLVFFGFGVLVTKDIYYEQAKAKIVEIADIYASNYTDAETAAKKLSDNIRVTVIAADGTVLADSEQVDLDALDSHLEREEILAAGEGKPKTVVRYSETLGKDMVYYAVKIDTAEGGVYIRVSTPVENVNDYVIGSIPLMLCVLCGALLASLIASTVIGNKLLKPLREIDRNLNSVRNGTYKSVMPTSSDEDINKMLISINDISEQLQETLAFANEERERLDYILDNVSDGILVIDTGGEMVIVNRNAGMIFGVIDAVGKNFGILTYHSDFNQAVGKCLSSREETTLEYETEKGRVYLTSIRSLERGYTIVVLSDITAVKNNEKTRSEFFANASHELKTPLTAIKGFNDMILLKSSEESVREFSAHVDKEISRIVVLINDMLDLSKLENQKEPSPVKLNLHELTEEVLDSLSQAASSRNITVSLSGEGEICAEKEHMTELIKNLIENGIRYNNPGGSVEVILSEEEKGVKLTVRDNGIGIEEKHQQRVFERFYRVNKSRSRETGGTGLGLAIVKHICELYHAELTLDSKLGVGTTVCVVFPKK